MGSEPGMSSLTRRLLSLTSLCPVSANIQCGQLVDEDTPMPPHCPQAGCCAATLPRTLDAAARDDMEIFMLASNHD